ncbi:MAG: hypothetical protein HUN04_12575 [Desulfobacter sp.]|nr:MAG: hypothetical protein HUN04_12575 [Desulfobacter sp.]
MKKIFYLSIIAVVTMVYLFFQNYYIAQMPAPDKPDHGVPEAYEMTTEMPAPDYPAMPVPAPDNPTPGIPEAYEPDGIMPAPDQPDEIDEMPTWDNPIPEPAEPYQLEKMPAPDNPEDQ